MPAFATQPSAWLQNTFAERVRVDLSTTHTSIRSKRRLLRLSKVRVTGIGNIGRISSCLKTGGNLHEQYTGCGPNQVGANGRAIRLCSPEKVTRDLLVCCPLKSPEMTLP